MEMGEIANYANCSVTECTQAASRFVEYGADERENVMNAMCAKRMERMRVCARVCVSITITRPIGHGSISTLKPGLRVRAQAGCVPRSFGIATQAKEFWGAFWSCIIPLLYFYSNCGQNQGEMKSKIVCEVIGQLLRIRS